MVCKHRWYLVAIRRRKLIIIWEVLFISDFYTVKYICSNLCMWECLMKKNISDGRKIFFTSQLQKTSIPLRKNVFLIVVKCQVFWLRWKLRYFNLGCALTNSKKHTSLKKLVNNFSKRNLNSAPLWTKLFLIDIIMKMNR